MLPHLSFVFNFYFLWLPSLPYEKSSNNLLKKLTTELKGGIIIIGEG